MAIGCGTGQGVRVRRLDAFAKCRGILASLAGQALIATSHNAPTRCSPQESRDHRHPLKKGRWAFVQTMPTVSGCWMQTQAALLLVSLTFRFWR